MKAVTQARLGFVTALVAAALFVISCAGWLAARWGWLAFMGGVFLSVPSWMEGRRRVLEGRASLNVVSFAAARRALRGQ